jgi:hypothetical protein
MQETEQIKLMQETELIKLIQEIVSKNKRGANYKTTNKKQ